MAFPKINIGKQSPKKSFLDLSHDSNLTADFGSVTPISCIEMIPKQSISLSVRSQTTLMPLVVPTGGRLAYKMQHVFVPFHDLLESFDSLYANQNYNSFAGSYIPQSVPTVTPAMLAGVLFAHSYFDVYRIGQAVAGKGTPYTQVTTAAGEYPSFDDIGVGIRDTLFNTMGVDFATWFGKPYGIADDHFAFEVDNQKKYHISIDSADFIVNTSASGYQWRFKLNDTAKRLRKIFIGLGYNIDPRDNYTNLSALPLFAYYKAYFDLFEIQRNVTYQDSAAYSALQLISGAGITQLNTLFELNADISEVEEDLRSKLFLFFKDLSNCFYTEKNSFVSAHIPTPAIVNDTMIKNSSASELENGIFELNRNTQPDIQLSDNMYTINTIVMGLRLQKLANISTAVGKRLKEYWLAMTGSSDLHLPESYNLGSSETFIDIDPLFSTAQTEGAVLAESAGKSFSRGESRTFKYEASTFGYWIILGSVVPYGNFFQGQASHLYHRTRWEFYNGIMDGVGFELTPKSMIMADNSVTRAQAGSEESFGFVPRYTNYKQHQSIVNGDMSLRSLRKSLLPYTLDKFITPRDTKQTHVPELISDKVTDYQLMFDSEIPIASEAWRYLNRYRWLSNYDRIFANGQLETTGNFDSPLWDITEDPVIINNIITVHSWAPMESVADSFDTDAFGDHISIEKA